MLYYIILYYIIIYYIILYYIILYYIVLYYILFYFILFYSILLYYILFYSIIFYYIYNEITRRPVELGVRAASWAISRVAWRVLAGSVWRRLARSGASSVLFRLTCSIYRSNLLAQASPGRPGLRKRLFFRGFGVRRPFDTRNVRHRKNTAKTNTKRTSEILRIDAKSIQNRSAWAPKSVQ